MRIYDCFTYFNEKDLVQLRFEELQFVVDFFVVVEATSTFSGEPKELFFDQLELDPYLSSKIIRVKTKFPPGEMSAWEREYYQRDAIMSGLHRAHAEDLVIISDADEIPDPQVLLDIQAAAENYAFPLQLDVKQFFWNYHWQVPDHCNQGARPVVARKSDLKNNTPQELRAAQLERLPDAGWHFSFFGKEDVIKYKIESFAHTEYNEREYKDAKKILHRIENGIDPFDRFPLKYREIDTSYPKTLQ